MPKLSQLDFFKTIGPALLATLGDEQAAIIATSRAWIQYKRGASHVYR